MLFAAAPHISIFDTYNSLSDPTSAIPRLSHSDTINMHTTGVCAIIDSSSTGRRSTFSRVEELHPSALLRRLAKTVSGTGSTLSRVGGLYPSAPLFLLADQLETFLRESGCSLSESEKDQVKSLARKLRDIRNCHNPLAPESTASIIQGRIDALEEGASTLIPGGYNTNSGGHFMLYEVKRTGPDSYSFCIFNTGEGTTPYLRTDQCRILAYQNLKKNHVTDMTFLRELMGHRCKKAEHTITGVYSTLDKFLCVGEKTYLEKRMLQQHYGTCAYAAVERYAWFYLGASLTPEAASLLQASLFLQGWKLFQATKPRIVALRTEVMERQRREKARELFDTYKTEKELQDYLNATRRANILYLLRCLFFYWFSNPSRAEIKKDVERKKILAIFHATPKNFDRCKRSYLRSLLSNDKESPRPLTSGDIAYLASLEAASEKIDETLKSTMAALRGQAEREISRARLYSATTPGDDHLADATQRQRYKADWEKISATLALIST
jgi:hypothetical protein